MRYKNIPPVPRSIWTNPLHFIAFGFGSGALPRAPGTWGTLIAIPIYLALSHLSLPFYITATVIITLISIWICDKVSREINVHDHQGMCLDEVVGYLVCMINVPHGSDWVIGGFVFFRIFDIWKPVFIKYVDEKVSGGLGMILDDVLAGVYVCIGLNVLAYLFRYY